MSILHSVGRALGSSAAYAVHGTHLASTSIAQGAKSGYVETSDRLRERRAELLANAAPVQRNPVASVQRLIADAINEKAGAEAEAKTKAKATA